LPGTVLAKPSVLLAHLKKMSLTADDLQTAR
jgi:hypothetical protein